MRGIEKICSAGSIGITLVFIGVTLAVMFRYERIIGELRSEVHALTRERTPGIISGSSAKHEVFVGTGAGPGTETYGGNVAMGTFAYANAGDRSFQNVAIGDYAMTASVATSGSVAIGGRSLLSAVECIDCVAVGYEAMAMAIDGVGGTAVGRRALEKAVSALNNTAIGDSALWQTQGTQNTALGYTAGDNNIDGDYNIYIGAAAGRNVTGGSGNVLIGTHAGYHERQITEPNNSIVIGLNAFSTGDNQVVIGNEKSEIFILGGIEFTKAELLKIKAGMNSAN